MAGATFTLTYDDAGVTAAMRQVLALANDLSPMLHDMGAELEASTSYRLRVSNLAPDGTPWAPSRRVALAGGHTLFETGEHLESTLRYELDGTTALEVGSPWEGAAVHQDGAVITAKGDYLHFSFATAGGHGFASVKSVTIPARPYLGVSEDDGVALINIAGEHIARAASDLFVGTA